MSEITIQRLRRAEWEAKNPVLRNGEPGIEINSNRMKVGDGRRSWDKLPWLAANVTAELKTVIESGSGGGVSSEDLAAAISTLQDKATAATDDDLSVAVSMITSALAAKEDSDNAATDTELTDAVNALTEVLSSKQDSSTAVTSSDISSAVATVQAYAIQRANHTGTQSADTVVDGTTNKVYTATEKTKLAGVADAATANSSDATLLARANHTGTQSADTLTDGSTNRLFSTAEKTKLSGVSDGATANSSDATLLSRANHTGTQSADTVVDGTTNKAYTATEKTKLAGVATGATANSTDAALLSRSNHTGTQSADTITDGTTNKAYTATEKTKLAGLPSSVPVSGGAGTSSILGAGATSADGNKSASLGDRTVASNTGAFASGQLTTASGTGSHAEGASCVASGSNSHAQGSSCQASGLASDAMGNAALANRENQQAHASGAISGAQGSSQACRYPMHQFTFGTTRKFLSTNGSNTISTTNAILCPENAAVAFSGLVVAHRQNDDVAASYEIKGVITRPTGGNVRFVGTPTVTQTFADAGAASWVVDVEANTTLQGLKIGLTGEAAVQIGWQGMIETCELTY